MASLAPAYVPRRPTETVLHQLVRANLESFLAYARANYDGGLPRYVEQEFRAYIRCGQSWGTAGKATAKLSTADLATLNGILEGVSFRSGPPSCPAADAGAEDGGVESIGMSVQRPDFSVYSVDITGCAQSAGASDVKTVYELLQAYPP